MEPTAPSYHPAGNHQVNRKHRRRTKRRTPEEIKQLGASSVTNGNRILLPLTKTAYLRRLTDLLNLHIDDLGGWGQVSNAEAAIVRRAVVLICECEKRESVFARTDEINDCMLATYTTAANSLRRLLESVGLRRDPSRAKTVRPLGDVLAELGPEDPKDPAPPNSTSPTGKGSTANGGGT
jgi:hypothetical protein